MKNHMINKKVSIITPCLNSEKTIRDTIESVLRQTYKNIEYIIVDGDSRDQTTKIITEYCPTFGERLKYISEKDNGIYDAMNKGIMLSSGDIIGIINSDDWYEPDTVERIVKCFEDTNADVVYGEIWIIDENGQRDYHTIHSSFPPHPSTFVKKEIYQRYGMFDLRYQIASDREFMLRLMEAGVRFEHIDRILAEFRKTGISNIKNLECAKESYEINLKYLEKCSEKYLNKKDIEESFDRARFLYISRRNPQTIREILNGKFGIPDKVIIFGVGNCGKELENILEECGITVIFFVDNDEKKWGLEYHGIKIYSPEILRYSSGHVLITVTRFQEDICSQLQNYLNPRLVWCMLGEIRKSVINTCEILELGK